MSNLRQEITEAFYRKVLQTEVVAGRLSLSSSILVACGGHTDQSVLASLGFSNVTISNLDERMSADAYAPFMWSSQDAECFTFEDRAFDLTIVHSGLHHCYSPHRAIVEMLRISRLGIIGFEPLDSLLTRIGSHFGIGQTYEDSAVFFHDCKYGGVANTSVPNYVYRFSTYELRKCFACAMPEGLPDVHFYYALRINRGRVETTKNPLVRTVLGAILRSAEILNHATHLFSNNLAFAVYKPSEEQLHPWIKRTANGYEANVDWLQSRYR